MNQTVCPTQGCPDEKMCTKLLTLPHHRIEKAARHGIEKLPAYILPMERHVAFIFKGCREYAKYSNSKLLDYENDIKRRDLICSR